MTGNKRRMSFLKKGERKAISVLLSTWNPPPHIKNNTMTKKFSSWRLHSSSRRPRERRRHQQHQPSASSKVQQQPLDAAGNDDGGDDGYESEADASEGGITCSSKYSAVVVTYTPRVAKAADFESGSGGSAVLGVGGGRKGGENRHQRGGGGPMMPPTSTTDGNVTSGTSATALELLRRMTIDNLSKLLTLPPPADPIVEPITTKTAVAVEEVAGYNIDCDDDNNNNKDHDEIEEVVEEAAAVVDETSKEITNMQHQQQQTRVVNNSTEEDKTSSSSSSSSDKTVDLGSGGSYETNLQVAVTEEDVPDNKSSGTITPPVGKSSGGFLKEDVRDIFGRIKYGTKKSSRMIIAKVQSRSPKVVRFRLRPSSSLLSSLTSAPKLANNSSSEMMLDTKSSCTIPDDGIEVDSAQPTRPEELLSSLSSSDKDTQLSVTTKKTTFEPFLPETCNSNWLNNSSSGPCSPMGVKDTLLERLCSPINEHDDESDESRSTKKMNNITTSLSKSMRSKFTNLCSPTQPSSINLLGQFDFDVGSRPWTPNHTSFDNTENNSNSNTINTTTTAPTSTIELGLPKSASKMLKKYKGREEEVLTNFKKMKAAKRTTSDDKVEVSESESTTTAKERLLAGEIITSTTQSNNCWLDALSSPMDTFNQFLSCSGGSGSNGTHKHRGGMTIDNLNDFNSSKSPRVHSWPLSKPEIHSNTAAVREKQAVELITNAEGIITQQADDLKEMQTEMDRQQSHQRNLTRQVAELQIELTNVKAKERELEDLKSKTAQEAQQAKNALETQRVAHMEELQKLESNLRLECQQAAKLVSVISQLQSEIALHDTQKKIYDEECKRKVKQQKQFKRLRRRS